jgi:hypothetical protein
VEDLSGGGGLVGNVQSKAAIPASQKKQGEEEMVNKRGEELYWGWAEIFQETGLLMGEGKKMAWAEEMRSVHARLAELRLKASSEWMLKHQAREHGR